MIRQALWLEWFKLRKRLATWVVYFIFLTLTLIFLERSSTAGLMGVCLARTWAFRTPGRLS